MDTEILIVNSIKNAIIDLGFESIAGNIEPALEPPKIEAYGDLSTNIAMRLAPIVNKNPRDLAKSIVEKIKLPEDICDKVEIAGPGFINFYFSINTVYKILHDIIKNPENCAKSLVGNKRKVLIEFVSANPTGPLTIAHARQAAVGDVLANIMTAAGFIVKKEYYLNDRGRQMRILGESAWARYMDLVGVSVDFPEDGYKGEYMLDIARSAIKEYGDKYKNIPKEKALDFFQQYTKDKIMDVIKKDLYDFGVEFNNWTSETQLVQSGIVEKTVKILEKNGYIFKQDDAVWFRSTEFGDDKDRVLIKSTGEMTYLMPDIGYHDGKYKRGYELLIDLWGPDHHGYIPRLKAAMQALGHPKDSLQVLIVQLSTLYKNGKQLSMSTRAGEFVSLRDLLHEVGKDAARYYLVMRKPEAHLDFDLDIAKKQTPDNPVYYIQYAHARIASIFAKYEEYSGHLVHKIDFSKVDVSFLKERDEITLIKFISQYPVIIEDCARILGPHLLTDYMETLVSKFHTYYEKYKVVSNDDKLTLARLFLIRAIQIVLQDSLKVLGVSVPEKM